MLFSPFFFFFWLILFWFYFYSFQLLPSLHCDTVKTVCVCEWESVYLECSSLVTVIVVVWVLLITGVNGWITARALCGCRVAGSRGERQRAGKLFLPSGDRGIEKGKQKGGKGEQQQTERPNWWPEPKGPGVHMEGNTLPCTLLHTLLF